MSTNLKPVTDLLITRYWGGRDREACLQLTQSSYSMGLNQQGYVNFAMRDIPELIEALAQIMQFKREEAE